MEKHQLSKMISGLSLLVAIISVIVPSVYAGDDEDNKKDFCKDNGGDWEDGQCDFATEDEDKVDAFGDDLADLRDFEEEKAALEDALCDDPKDSEKYDVCQGATLNFVSSEEEEHCEDNDGEWSKEEKSCNFDDEKDAEEYGKEKHNYLLTNQRTEVTLIGNIQNQINNYF